MKRWKNIWFVATVAMAVAMILVWRAPRPHPQPASIPPTVESASAVVTNRVVGPSRPVATPPVTPSLPAPATPSPAPATPLLARLRDNAVPVEQRREWIAALAQRGDATTLMTLGNDGAYLSDAAVEALGQIARPDVAVYLQGKLADDNPRVVAAALRSLAQVSGAQAVPAIAAALAQNRVRLDGFQDMVCAAGVQALGATKSSVAVPALGAELTETVGSRLSYDYGSQVVTALRAIGAASAVPALQAYRERLAAILARAPENPLGQRYLETKISEVDNAIAGLRK